MLTCITCSKKTEEEDTLGFPNTKHSVRTLTSQLKDLALKFSGSYKQCKPCNGSSSSGGRKYNEKISERIRYPFSEGGSSCSTPAWDFQNTGHRTEAAEIFGRTEDEGLFDSCAMEEQEEEEWTAQVEPGVHITFVSLRDGGNDLKRIRFSRETFNKEEAEKWWGSNYYRIRELYNVHQFNRQSLQQRDSSVSRYMTGRESNNPNNRRSAEEDDEDEDEDDNGGSLRSSREEASLSYYSNPSELEKEWVEEDEVGVYLTIRQYADGNRQLRRIRFSGERFGAAYAKLWWEENMERVLVQYL